MFDKNELSILLRCLENTIGTIKISCIYCEIVDCFEDYAKTKYCVERCSFCKEIEDIQSLVSKIKEVLK